MTTNYIGNNVSMPFVITVCSGKGGVGKSVMAANLALSMSMMNFQVLLWDADMNFPNQHLLLGVEPPIRLIDVYSKYVKAEKAIFPVYEKLHLLADMPAAGKSDQFEPSAIVDCFRQIVGETNYDIIIMDTPAGSSNITHQCCNLADLISLVITDEPTSLLDAYGLIKILLQYIDVDKLNLLVNNVIDFEDADDILTKLNLATEKFLQLQIGTLGFIPYDRAVRQSIIRQEPFVKFNPDSEASKAVEKLADSILYKIQTPELR